MPRLILNVVLFHALVPTTFVIAQPRDPAPPPGPSLDVILQRLRDADPKARQSAREDLPRIATPDMTESAALRLLRASGEEYPKPDAAETRIALAVAAGQKPTPALVPAVRDLFTRAQDELRDVLLVLLLKIDDRSASTAYMDLLARHLREDHVERLDTFPLRDKPRDADVFFPRLFDAAMQLEDATDVFNAALVYREHELLKDTDLGPQAHVLLKRYNLLLPKLTAAQRPTGIDWRWTPQYAPVRDEAEVLLDLFGYLPPDNVDGSLRSALDFTDPRLRFFAITSLLRHGQDVAQSAIDDVAAAGQTRRWLYRDLLKMSKADRFPAKYLNREAMAESDMIDWLTYPTELGREPDAIELMRRIAGPPASAGTPTDVYVYRFRAPDPRDPGRSVWLAGVAGPYPRDGSAAPDDLGGTFSLFEPSDAKSPEEHARAIAQALEESGGRSRESKK